MADQVNVGANTLVIKDGKLLMGVRLNTVGDGTWGVPGGHLEPGEELRTCARRELEEETGLIADELEFVSVINQPRQPGGDKHYIQVVFLVTKFHGDLENREPENCSGWEWVDPNELSEPIFFAHQTIIAAFKERVPLYDPDPAL